MVVASLRCVRMCSRQGTRRLLVGSQKISSSTSIDSVETALAFDLPTFHQCITIEQSHSASVNRKPSPPHKVFKFVWEYHAPYQGIWALQYQKGPVWESGLGQVAWKGFEQYRICVLNDTPLGGIDPFTWQAPEFVKPSPAVIKAPSVDKTPTAIPAIPTPQPTVSAPSPTPTITPRPVPKAVFTGHQLANFLLTIEGSDKLKRALIFELSGRFPSVGTQMSIKAKLEEVASKPGTKGSVWLSSLLLGSRRVLFLQVQMFRRRVFASKFAMEPGSE